MPEITPERLAEIEARCEAATPPPWIWVEGLSSFFCPTGIVDAKGRSIFVCAEEMSGEPSKEDRDFLVNAYPGSCGRAS
jgi:hypothetical protein